MGFNIDGCHKRHWLWQLGHAQQLPPRAVQAYLRRRIPAGGTIAEVVTEPALGQHHACACQQP